MFDIFYVIFTKLQDFGSCNANVYAKAIQRSSKLKNRLLFKYLGKSRLYFSFKACCMLCALQYFNSGRKKTHIQNIFGLQPTFKIVS